MLLPYEKNVWGARKIAFGITALAGIGVGSFAAVVANDPSSSSDFSCQNPLPGRHNITLEAGAYVRTVPHRYEDVRSHMAGRRLQSTVTFDTSDVDVVCVSVNDGTWYGFEDGEFSKLADQTFHGNDHHGVWVKEVNVTLEPIE